MLHPLENIMLEEIDGALSITGAVALLPEALRRARIFGLVLVGTESGIGLLRHSGSARQWRLANEISSWSKVESMMTRQRRRSAAAVVLEDHEVNTWVGERKIWYKAMIRLAHHHEELKEVGLFLMGTKFGIDVLERAPIAGARAAAENIMPMPQSIVQLG